MEKMTAGFSELMGSVINGDNAPLAIVLTAIVTVFGIYMKANSTTPVTSLDNNAEDDEE